MSVSVSFANLQYSFDLKRVLFETHYQRDTIQ